MLGLNEHGYSPSVFEKIVTAGAELKSFAVAARMVNKLAEVSISAAHLRELTQQVGQELQQRRDEQTEQYRRRTLTPQVPNVPELAVIETDGGRWHKRAEGRGRGVHDPGWKEDKVASLLRMQGTEQDADPHPEPPRCFLDRAEVKALVQEIGGGGAARAEAPQTAEPPHAGNAAGTATGNAAGTATGNTAGTATGNTAGTATGNAAGTATGNAAGNGTGTDAAATAAKTSEQRSWPPRPLVRTCVASTAESDRFGPMVAAEAQRRNFFAAARRAFLGDGQEWNWTIWRTYFSGFLAILDFVHLLTYLYGAAAAVLAEESAQWRLYVEWMTACWQGRVDAVLAALRQWQERLGPIAEGEDPDENDPRVVLARTVTYMGNNRERMDYPRYRRLGLPVTTSAVESLINEVNYRVKAVGKFWNPSGAEPILQVRAASLSEDDRLSKHLRSRPGNPYRYGRRTTSKRKAA